MDALALLCTLYAEGPVTLARLRQADCTTIEAVLASDPRALASILMSTEATAERFQREARNLGERVGTSEVEPDLGSHATNRSRGVRARPAVLERVLAAWRERDEHDADAGDEHRSELAYMPNEREEILQPALPARASMPRLAQEQKPEPTLAVGAVDGLDAEAAVALARAGVRDLRVLATCDTLALARSSGLSWSRLNRLRALAARVPGVAGLVDEERNSGANGVAEKSAVGEDAAENEIEEKISPSERPLDGHEGLAQLDRVPHSALPVPRPNVAPMQTATTAPRYPARAPEGAGGPFA